MGSKWLQVESLEMPWMLLSGELTTLLKPIQNPMFSMERYSTTTISSVCSSFICCLRIIIFLAIHIKIFICFYITIYIIYKFSFVLLCISHSTYWFYSVKTEHYFNWNKVVYGLSLCHFHSFNFRLMKYSQI